MRFKFALILAALMLLCGCTSESIESSLRLPKMPEEFIEFNDELNEIKATGMELISPSGGTNRQAVQLADLDGDGIDEGIAVFREFSDAHRTCAYIFKKENDGYSVFSKIDGAGDTVESISYADLLGNGNNDLIIGWSVSDSDARSITVHSMKDGEIKKLCELASIYHLTYDITGDIISDLCVVHEDESGAGQALSVYVQRETSLVLAGSVPLSTDAGKILRIRAGYATDVLPAIYVEKEYKNSGIITDIIVWENDVPVNKTYSEESRSSDITARNNGMFCEDIDGDAALEVPIVQTVPEGYAAPEGDVIPGVVWHGFDSDGNFVKKSYSFRQNDENWHITLPIDWMARTVASHYDAAFSESVTAFYGYDAKGSAIPLFNIIAISGENREARAAQQGYSKISERGDVIYVVEISRKRYLGYDITAEMLTERFSYSSGVWSTGEVVF